MVRILDEDDYRRRLDQAIEIPVGEEIGLLVKGFFTGVVLGPLQARNDILLEKQKAACSRAPRDAQGDPRRERARPRGGGHSDRRAGNRHRVI